MVLALLLKACTGGALTCLLLLLLSVVMALVLVCASKRKGKKGMKLRPLLALKATPPVRMLTVPARESFRESFPLLAL